MVVYPIVILLIFIGFVYPKNNRISFLFWIFLAWLAISAPTDYLNDYLEYKRVYDNLYLNQQVFEKGYTLLERLSVHLGLSFDQFRDIFLVLAIAILAFGVNRFTSNHAFFVGVYAATTFAFDLVQMRSFMMLSIVVVAYSFLISSNLRSYVVSIVLIFVAASFHSSGYFLLLGVFLIATVKRINRYLLRIPIFFSAVFVLLPILFRNGLFLSAIEKLANITGRGNLVIKLTETFTNGASGRSELYSFALSVLVFILIRIVSSENGKMTFEIQKVKVLFFGMMMLFLGFSFLSLAADYSRLLRVGVTFTIIYVGYYLTVVNFFERYTVRRFISTGLITVIIFLAFMTSYVGWGDGMRLTFWYILHAKSAML